MIHLDSASTPNGHQASVTLEEVGLAHDVDPIHLAKNEQEEGSF
jgi:glutathione S-transferase